LLALLYWHTAIIIILITISKNNSAMIVAIAIMTQTATIQITKKLSKNISIAIIQSNNINITKSSIVSIKAIVIATREVHLVLVILV